MRSLGGLILLAGVGFGLFVYLPAPVSHDASLGNARLAAKSASPKEPASRSVAARRLRSFSPSISLTAFTGQSAPSVSARDAAGGWRTASANEAPYSSLQPTSPESRDRLVRDLQEQLKRVGCYDGRIDGSWGPGSKYAMQSFMQRVNAELPSHEPDYLLLRLLKSQQGTVCGACPSNQLVSQNGRCVPQNTIAYGRSGEERTTAARETLPWQASTSRTATASPNPAAKPLFTPLPTSTVSTEPLPGRMAIGGPKALPPVNTVYAPQATSASNGTETAAAIGPDGVPPGASVSSDPKPAKAKTYKRAHRRDGPGTPRYNLMLSLGGVY